MSTSNPAKTELRLYTDNDPPDEQILPQSNTASPLDMSSSLSWGQGRLLYINTNFISIKKSAL